MIIKIHVKNENTVKDSTISFEKVDIIIYVKTSLKNQRS